MQLAIGNVLRSSRHCTPHLVMSLGPKTHADNVAVQLSNLDTLRAYLLGSGSERKLPVQRAFKNDVVGTSAEELATLARDFGAWLSGNCSQQLQAYRCFSGHSRACDCSCHMSASHASQLQCLCEGIAQTLFDLGPGACSTG